MHPQTKKKLQGLEPFASRVWLSSPTMHGDEQRWVDEAIRTNWVSTVGENINVLEREVASYVGVRHAVALSAGTAALHLAIKLAGERLYGQPKVGHGTLEGRKVFCSDMTFDATVNPVVYEGAERQQDDARAAECGDRGRDAVLWVVLRHRRILVE